MNEQRVEQRAEDAALGRGSVEDDGGGYGVVNPSRLGSGCFELTYNILLLEILT